MKTIAAPPKSSKPFGIGNTSLQADRSFQVDGDLRAPLGRGEAAYFSLLSRLVTTVALLCFFISTTNLPAQEINLATLQEKTTIPCNSLIYGGSQTSVCFADHFLTRVSKETTLKAARAFTSVQLGTDALFNSPFSVWSGEGSFTLTQRERDNLRKYLTCGGFIVASPGCSNAAWDASFRNELRLAFPETKLSRIPMSHQIFSTVYQVAHLTLMHGGTAGLLEGLEINGRLVLAYSREGLNDARNAKGCCCCGGDQINEGETINVNLFTYALLY